MDIRDIFLKPFKAVFASKDAPQKVEKKEQGFYKSPYYGKSMDDPYNPDTLVAKKGLEVYDDMLLDDQVKAVMSLKKYSILSQGGEFMAASDDDKDVEIADFLNYAVTEGMQSSFKKAVWDIMSAYTYGFSVTEKIFKPLKDGPHKGKIGLAALKTRPPHSIEFHLDPHGNIKNLLQHADGGDIPLDPAYFIVYSYATEFGNPYGVSDLRSAYRSYYSKKINIAFLNIYNERYGMPPSLGFLPAGVGKTEQTDLFNMLKNLQAKSVGVFSEDTKIEFPKIATSGETTYESAIRYYDKSIARSILVPDMLGFTDSSYGSRSLGETQSDIWMMILEYHRQELSEQIYEQLIKQLVDINFTNVQTYPQYVFKPIDKEDKIKISDAFTRAVKEGVIQPRPEDEVYTRTLLGYPDVDVDQIDLPNEQPINPTTPAQDKPTAPEDDSPEAKDGDDIDDAIDKDEASKEAFAASAVRKLSSFERRIDFAAVKGKLDTAETKMVNSMQAVVRDTLDSAVQTIKSKKILENKDMSAVANFQLKGIGDIRKTIQFGLRELYDDGRKDGNKTLKKTFTLAGSLNLPPTKAIKWFDTESILAAGAVKDDLTKKTKQVLMSSLKNGTPLDETVYELNKAYQPYLEGAVEAGAADAPYRLETLARTSLATAYNMGNMQSYEESSSVSAYQYSAVLDDRTSDYCMAMDGEIFDKSDPAIHRATPPNHFNCRSLLVPIFKDEKYTISKQNPDSPQSVKTDIVAGRTRPAVDAEGNKIYEKDTTARGQGF